MNSRQIEEQLNTHFGKYKQALILLGPRQVGKTTVVRKVFPNALYLLVDEKPVQNLFETYSSDVYRQFVGESKQIIIDEIHQLSDPGRAVKILYDQFEGLQIIVTGSSALNIKNKTSESMAGRAIYYYMYPLTFSEYLYQTNIEKEININILKKIINLNNTRSIKLFDLQSILNQVLIFGLYPSLINIPSDKAYLNNLADAAIFKDILELNLIEDRTKAFDLLKILAYQIGNLINYSELGTRVGLDPKTVQKYIGIFEESFILFRLYPYSTLKRNEIGKTPKIYFYDLGLRNALIRNYDEINIRNDSGALFENFIVSELKKLLKYTNSDWMLNYWRSKEGFEVDTVLSTNAKLIGCEIKRKNGKITKAFKNRYKKAETILINSENFY